MKAPRCPLCGGAGRKIGGINQYQCGRKRCKCTFRKVDQDDRATTHDLLKWAKELLMAHGYGNVAISVRAAMPGIPDVPITPALLMERGTGKTRTHYDHIHKRGYSPQKGRPAMEQIVEQLQFAHQKRLPPGTQMYAELDAAGKKVDIYDQDDVCVSGSLYIRKAHIERRYGGRVPKGYKVTLEPIFE